MDYQEDFGEEFTEYTEQPTGGTEMIQATTMEIISHSAAALFVIIATICVVINLFDRRR